MDLDAATFELDAWCQSYVTAFSTYDVAAIGAHWAFPALILVNGAPVLLPSREKFDRNTQNLCAFYRAQSVAAAERKLLDVLVMTSTTAAICVADTMLNEAGEEITSWRAAYTLTRTQEGWRACLADVGGEMAAWAARGTPLGGT